LHHNQHMDAGKDDQGRWKLRVEREGGREGGRERR
jgi:hypothetical protein